MVFRLDSKGGNVGIPGIRKAWKNHPENHGEVDKMIVGGGMAFTFAKVTRTLGGEYEGQWKKMFGQLSISQCILVFV